MDLHGFACIFMDLPGFAWVCTDLHGLTGSPLGQLLRDARTFTLHFRDDLYVERLAQLALGNGFSAKGGRGGSTPFEEGAGATAQAPAGA